MVVLEVLGRQPRVTVVGAVQAETDLDRNTMLNLGILVVMFVFTCSSLTFLSLCVLLCSCPRLMITIVFRTYPTPVKYDVHRQL